ncbi:MAG: DNA-processing protein DprA [Thermomicrobiales bacterium]|nr:DNA-processing protein DprA [Thermomicrobiales bacterium]
MSEHRRIEAILRLGAVPGYGPARTRLMMEQLAATESALEYLPEYEIVDLLELGLDASQAAAFLDYEPNDLADRLLDAGIHLVTMLDANAPRKLLSGPISPWFFVYGDVSALGNESIGFSGSRDASPEAIEATMQIAAAAVDRGWTVISGGARGIDTAAHQGALDRGGATAILLPQGILGWRSAEMPGDGELVIMSEFQPLDGWSSYRAMQRNKSIVHLSDRLVIPQAGVKGGTMNAAEYALKANHPTWVIDLGPEYEGNRLIARKGARILPWANDPTDLDMLVTAEDILRFGQQSLELPLPEST